MFYMGLTIRTFHQQVVYISNLLMTITIIYYFYYFYNLFVDISIISLINFNKVGHIHYIIRWMNWLLDD